MTTTVALVLGALLAAGVVVLVALPFLREPVARDDRLDAPDEAASRRLRLVEERDRALAALKELEFDHRTGKLADADYQELVSPLRQAAARSLRALEPADLPPEPGPPPDEGTLPVPDPVPEPYPPPDEVTVPSPASAKE